MRIVGALSAGALMLGLLPGAHAGRMPMQVSYVVRGGPEGSRAAVCLQAPDGAAARRAVRLSGRFLSVAWSGDGTKLAVGHRGGVEILRPAGTVHTRVYGGASDPVWSLRAPSLAFVERGALYVLRNGRVRHLADDPDDQDLTSVRAPSAGQDGRIFYWVVRVGPVSWSLHSLFPDGTRRRAYQRPRWFARISPDGRRYAYVDRGRLVVGWMNRPGTVVVAGDAPQPVDTPTWSPDSRLIAYVRRSYDQAPADVYVTDAEGKTERRLTATPYDEVAPSWRSGPIGRTFGACRPPR